MPLKEPLFTIGLEEEYLLVDCASRDLVREVPPQLFQDCERALRGQVAREFLKSQIEVETRVHKTVRAAGAELASLRQTVARLAAQHGLAPVAASTHPFARWGAQQATERERYQAIAKDLAGVGRRLVFCGMHVHVGVEDDELRIDLMNQGRYFLPHLLVLSTSSPFAEGEDTGLKCYRLAAYNELPRTGLPQRFGSWAEYRHTVDLLVRNGIIEDASKIWWDLRPSARFPTLELRIPDVCTLLDDARCVAALYVSILRMLYRIRRSNQTWRSYPLFLLSENRWRAQRYGVSGTLFDFGKGELVPFGDLVEELLAMVSEDAESLGCWPEVEHARTIVKRGTSADRQVACFSELLAEGASREDALRGVVDHLIRETASDPVIVPPTSRHPPPAPRP
ncbi:MAG TPA: carboxylate-amine ligase [Hyphomicrobiaceae bacterium]|jgi:carboxylate-amine ligase|nr:carboxylate-amine ligase [Hyphomicrobiaceae bacterium]